MKYFVRNDIKIKDTLIDNNIREAHILYLKNHSIENFILAGVFKDTPGGMIVFKAENYDKANEFCRNDPVILSGHYEYKLIEWNVLIESYLLINPNHQ